MALNKRRKRTSVAMSLGLLTCTTGLVGLLGGCSSHEDIDIANNFFTRSSGTTAELQPARVALYLRDKEDHSTLVWPALAYGFGGPYAIEDGILFCARNQANKIALFAANKRGIVAEITAYAVPGATREHEVRQIQAVADKVQIDLWSATGELVTAPLTKSDLSRLAEKRVAEGEKVRWRRIEFYR